MPTSVNVTVPPIKNQFATLDEVNAANAYTARNTPPAPVKPPVTKDSLMTEALRIKGELDTLAAQKKEPTIGQSMGDLGFEQGKTYEELYGTEPDEKKIYRDKLRMFQKDIDATNQVYDQMLAQARLEGQGRLGSTRAISARSGLLGSDFGAAQKEKTIGINTGITQGIQAERAAKIGSIMGDVRKSVLDEVTAKNTARQQGAENYIAYLASTATRKKANLDKAANAFLLNEIDPSELDPTELAEIAKEGGLTPDSIKMQYLQLKKAQEAEAAKAEREGQFNLSEGGARYDAEGNIIASRPKTYAPKDGEDKEVKPGVYDSIDKVPATIYVDIVSNIKSNPDATIDDIANTYPELTYTTIQEIYNENATVKEEPGLLEKVGNWWDSLTE